MYLIRTQLMFLQNDNNKMDNKIKSKLFSRNTECKLFGMPNKILTSSPINRIEIAFKSEFPFI